jgi:hypothetical protein
MEFSLATSNVFDAIARGIKLAKECYELLVQRNARLDLRFMPEEFTAAALIRSANGISPSWKNYEKIQADSFGGSREGKERARQITLVTRSRNVCRSKTSHGLILYHFTKKERERARGRDEARRR